MKSCNGTDILGLAEAHCWDSVRKLWAPSGQKLVRRPSAKVRAELRDLDLMNRTRRDPKLQREFIRRYQAGEPGVDAILWRIYYKFVIFRLKRLGLWRNTDEASDWAQEARMGMLEGCARYDLQSETRPISFLGHYIRGYALKRFRYSGEVVRRPLHEHNACKKRGGPRMITVLFSAMEDHSNEWTRQSFEDTLTDDAPLAIDSLSDTIKDYYPLIALHLIDALDLPNRSRLWQAIVQRRLLAEEPEPLVDLGAKFHLSRERVRQIECAIIRHMSEAAVRLGAPPITRRGFDDWILRAAYCLGLRANPPDGQQRLEHRRYTLPGQRRARKPLRFVEVSTVAHLGPRAANGIQPDERDQDDAVG